MSQKSSFDGQIHFWWHLIKTTLSAYMLVVRTLVTDMGEVL